MAEIPHFKINAENWAIHKTTYLLNQRKLPSQNQTDALWDLAATKIATATVEALSHVFAITQSPSSIPSLKMKFATIWRIPRSICLIVVVHATIQLARRSPAIHRRAIVHYISLKGISILFTFLPILFLIHQSRVWSYS